MANLTDIFGGDVPGNPATGMMAGDGATSLGHIGDLGFSPDTHDANGGTGDDGDGESGPLQAVDFGPRYAAGGSDPAGDSVDPSFHHDPGNFTLADGDQSI